MVIDVAKCNGCERCVAVCSSANQLPGTVAWRRITTAEIALGSARRRIFLPISCMHCAEPPCHDVCPTGATYRHPDGVVDIDADKCIGCGYCTVACPYSARTIAPHGADRYSSSVKAGVCTKCDMCHSKVLAGLARGLTPGQDLQATPSCVTACLWNAIHFGDAEDPDSTVSRLLKQHRAVRINEELGTDPSIFYINADAGFEPTNEFPA